MRFCLKKEKGSGNLAMKNLVLLKHHMQTMVEFISLDWNKYTHLLLDNLVHIACHTLLSLYN